MTASSELRPRPRFPGRTGLVLPAAIALLGACSNTVVGADPGGPAGATTGNGGGGASGASGASGNAGTSSAGTSSGASGASGFGGTGIAGGGPTPQCADQTAITPGQAPLRRLTIPEYNHTVRDIIGETSNPAFQFPS